jgi:hypothetical protein
MPVSLNPIAMATTSPEPMMLSGSHVRTKLMLRCSSRLSGKQQRAAITRSAVYSDGRRLDCAEGLACLVP